MNINRLAIALLLTISPLVQTGPLEWMRKHPYITGAAMALSAAGMYYANATTSDDDHNHQDLSERQKEQNHSSLTISEGGNSSPIPALEDISSKVFLSIEQDKPTPSKSIPIHVGAYEEYLVPVQTTFDRAKKPVKSCLAKFHAKEAKRASFDLLDERTLSRT